VTGPPAVTNVPNCTANGITAATKSVVPRVREPPWTLVSTDPGSRMPLSVLWVSGLRAPSSNCVSVSQGICCHHVPNYDKFRDAQGGYVQSNDLYVTIT